jgi:hypothetical protein
MGKNSDIESISNSISKTILHEILIEHSNRPEAYPPLKKEEIEYRGQSMKKIDKRRLNEDDKKIIRDKVIRKINNRLKLRYSDINIPVEIVSKNVDESLFLFFD